MQCFSVTNLQYSYATCNFAIAW